MPKYKSDASKDRIYYTRWTEYYSVEVGDK